MSLVRILEKDDKTIAWLSDEDGAKFKSGETVLLRISAPPDEDGLRAECVTQVKVLIEIFGMSKKTLPQAKSTNAGCTEFVVESDIDTTDMMFY